MRKVTQSIVGAILGFALAAIVLAPSVALAAPADTNSVYLSFGADVTTSEQHFLVSSKTGANKVSIGSCDAWLLENDDAVDTIWIKWSVPGSSTLPVAVADPTDATPSKNQMRLKPGQAKSLRLWANTYVSVIGTGAAHLHAELNCPQGG